MLEQVQQLKASNEQLQAQLRAPSQVPDLQSGPETVNNAPSRDLQNEAVGVRYVYVPKERKCPKFTGKMSIDQLTVEQWVEEVRKCLQVRPMSLAEQLVFIMDHLEGGAKNEVDFYPLVCRDTPEKLFAVLTKNYSCAQSYVAAQSQLFQRTQHEGESLREYSHALKSLMDVAVRKTPGGIPNHDMILRDQFIEHVLDDSLRRELKQCVLKSPHLSFLDLREAALNWAEASRPGSKNRSRVFSCDSQCTGMGEVNASVVSVNQTDEIAQIKESLRRQQVQLDTILQHLTAQPPHPRQSHVAVNPSTRSRDSTDKPVCHRCSKPGHIARFCRVNLKNVSRRTPPITEAAFSNQTAGNNFDSQLSGN